MTEQEDRLAYLEEKVDQLLRFQIVATHRIQELERKEMLLVQHMTVQFAAISEYIEQDYNKVQSLFS